jgi:hypothetical protein
MDLDRWSKTLPQPWMSATEATVFIGWIYDHLKPHAAALNVAHPLILRAIAAAKKKNDRIDAHKIADCLPCDFLPEFYSKTAILFFINHFVSACGIAVSEHVHPHLQFSSFEMAQQLAGRW